MRESAHPATGTNLFQSTPPVAGRRCLPAIEMRRQVLAVSIHASRCREAMRRGWHPEGRGIVVSIHASRCREAMLIETRKDQMEKLFQSTPPVAGRRCASRHIRRLERICFNPRLPLPGGDASRLSRCVARYWLFQSTPPVAGRRCFAHLARIKSSHCFNPRLPLPGGDARDVMVNAGDLAVSIHASRCREAMRRGRRFCGACRGCFNPRLPLPGGDAR